MLYRKVPKTGDELSILGFGCMRLPQKRGKIDEERATRQLRYAIDQGVNYIDTAVPYHNGASEPFVGRALEGGYRERVRLATKLPPWSVKRREDMDLILDAQLEKLRTDHIDYYLVHSLAREPWEKMKALGVREFLDKAKQAGKIVNAGFSFHGDRDAFREIVDGYEWDFCQIQYNFLDEENQAGTDGLEYAASKQLAVMIMEPLRGGNLAGEPPEQVGGIWDEAEVKRSPAEWGLRWIWNHPEVTVILSGMNEEDHIEENLRVAAEGYPGSLTAGEVHLVSRVRDMYQQLMKVGCTGCRYCMPCPFGVNIAECFAIYNNYHMFDDKLSTKVQYLGRMGGVIGDEGYAGLCRQCGRCVKACPQHLHIPEILADVSRTLEGRTMGLKIPVMRFAVSLHARLTRPSGRQKRGN